MSNWIADEVRKMTKWVEEKFSSHHSEIESLKSRVSALEAELAAKSDVHE